MHLSKVQTVEVVCR